MNFVEQLNRLLEPLRTRIKMLVCKAIITLVDDSTNIQMTQIELLKDEVRDKVPRLQNYGFTSYPKPGSRSLVLFISGNRDSGFVIATEDARYRVKNLPEGGVAVYDNDGNIIKLTEENGIEINAPNKKVVIDASDNVEIGSSNLKRLVNEEFTLLFNNHTHRYVEGTLIAGTTPVTSVVPGAAITTGPVTGITDNELTNKLRAE